MKGWLPLGARLKNRLFELRLEKEREIGERLTQKRLAQVVGASEGLISRWMRNKVTRYDTDVVEKLCEYFDCEVHDLLYIEKT